MPNVNPKLIIMSIVLLVAVILTPFNISSVRAASTNAIMNPGFESDTDWEARYSSFQGSYAAVQDSQYHRTGSYSGLTKTTNPKQEMCSASLYQSLNVSVSNLSAFSYGIRRGESAADGYYSAKACIHLSGNYKLYYYHGLDWSSPPPDGTTYKYINVGNLVKPFFYLISRNLLEDLLDKFGASVLTKNVTAIELFSHGFKNLYTGQKYGQRINWDDVFMESEPTMLTINLTSSTIDGYINRGNITFDGVKYSLPTAIEKPPGIYLVTANPSDDYIFDYWKTGQGLIATENTTSAYITVLESGNLEVHYTARMWTIMVYMAADAWDIETTSLLDINDMEMIGPTKEVQIVVMLDRYDAQGKETEGEFEQFDEMTFKLKKDTNPDVIRTDDRISTYTEVNMAAPDTLTTFVAQSVLCTPSSRHYALILQGHGGGYNGVCEDVTPDENVFIFPGDRLNMTELKQALTDITTNPHWGISPDLIGFDSCLMGQTEVAYQVKDFADVFVGSQEVEWIGYANWTFGRSWPYQWILGNLTENPLMSACELGTQIVTSYGHHVDKYYYMMSKPPTMAASNTSGIQKLAASVGDMGSWLTDNYETYENEIIQARENVWEAHGYDQFVDAFNLTQALNESISDTTLEYLCEMVQGNITSVLISEWHRSDAVGTHGLSLYFPDDEDVYDTKYQAIDMSTDLEWNAFLECFHNPP